MGGGTIRPTGSISNDSEQPVPLWHWAPGYNVSEDTKQIKSMILPNTRIRVGAITNPGLIGAASLNTSCLLNTLDFNGVVIEKMWRRLSQLGTTSGSVEVKSATVGIQAGQILVPVGTVEMGWEKGRTAKQNILIPSASIDQEMAKLKKPWGLFVSLCTGVMSRVCLGEVVAFLGPRCMRDLIPCDEGQIAGNSSVPMDLAQTFRDATDLGTWAMSLSPSNQEKVVNLSKAVLDKLQHTGLDSHKKLVLGCVSDDRSLDSYKIPCKGDNEWTRVLSDSTEAATFACITPCCLQTPTRKCQRKGSANFELPRSFCLSTRVGIHEKNSRTGNEATVAVGIRPGKSYRINSGDSMLLATAVTGSDPLYFTVKKQNPLLCVISRIEKKMIIRESNASWAIECIIGPLYEER